MTGVGEEQPETPATDRRPEGANPPNQPESRGFLGRLGGRFTTWRDSIRARPAPYRVYRVVVGVVGGAIVIGGLALVPLPGPGWVIVFVGLAVLATEFTWADRLDTFARNQVKAWTTWLGGQAVWVRILFGLLTFMVVAGVLYGLFVAIGVPGWVPDAWVEHVPGLENA